MHGWTLISSSELLSRHNHAEFSCTEEQGFPLSSIASRIAQYRFHSFRAGGIDFSFEPVTLQSGPFIDGSQVLCVDTIMIINDDEVEGLESFQLSLTVETAPIPVTVVAPQVATVIIEDNDGESVT